MSNFLSILGVAIVFFLFKAVLVRFLGGEFFKLHMELVLTEHREEFGQLTMLKDDCGIESEGRLGV